MTTGGKSDDAFLPYKFFQSIRDNRGLSSSAKLVAFVLGSHANGESNIVWPSVQTIAAEAALSVDTVEYALTGLDKAGVQKPIGWHGKTRSRALFPARHDARTVGRRKRNVPGPTRDNLPGTTRDKVTTKITTDDQHRVGEITGSPDGDQAVVEFKEGYPIPASSTLTIPPLDSRSGTPENFRPRCSTTAARSAAVLSLATRNTTAPTVH